MNLCLKIKSRIKAEIENGLNSINHCIVCLWQARAAGAASMGRGQRLPNAGHHPFQLAPWTNPRARLSPAGKMEETQKKHALQREKLAGSKRRREHKVEWEMGEGTPRSQDEWKRSPWQKRTSQKAVESPYQSSCKPKRTVTCRQSPHRSKVKVREGRSGTEKIPVHWAYTLFSPMTLRKAKGERVRNEMCSSASEVGGRKVVF